MPIQKAQSFFLPYSSFVNLQSLYVDASSGVFDSNSVHLGFVMNPGIDFINGRKSLLVTDYNIVSTYIA